MKWSRELHGRWMETCYLCKGHVEEEVRASLERHYACTNSGCATRFRLYLSHPRVGKKHGIFACLIMRSSGILKEAMGTFLHDELYGSCPVCDAEFFDRGDGVLLCPSNDGVSVEFYLETLHMSFVALFVMMRVPEPGFSKVLSKNQEPRRYN